MTIKLEATVSPGGVQELLNENIQIIGMGAYQWKLFFLCGLGWAADNMYLQVIMIYSRH